MNSVIWWLILANLTPCMSFLDAETPDDHGQVEMPLGAKFSKGHLPYLVLVVVVLVCLQAKGLAVGMLPRSGACVFGLR